MAMQPQNMETILAKFSPKEDLDLNASTIRKSTIYTRDRCWDPAAGLQVT